MVGKHVLDATERTHHILYYKFRTNICKVVSEIKHLSEEERVMLNKILIKNELTLDGILVTWKTKPLDIELQPYFQTISR